MTNIIIFLLHIKEFGVFQINWQIFIYDALKDIYSNNETVLYISFVSYPLWNWKHAKNLNYNSHLLHNFKIPFSKSDRIPFNSFTIID